MEILCPKDISKFIFWTISDKSTDSLSVILYENEIILWKEFMTNSDKCYRQLAVKSQIKSNQKLLQYWQ